jgi:hypothetical protein
MERGQRDWRSNETVLDGGRVDCPNRDTVVDGFTIRVAPGDYEGYGVSAGSGPVAIANNTIMGNAQFGSYGVRTDYSKVPSPTTPSRATAMA